MSKQKKYAGETSVSLAVFIQDTSSTTGGGLAGVTSASSGLVFEYRRQGQSSWTSVTPVAGKVLGTYLSGGIVADGALSGAYEVDFPDAAFAAGAKAVFLRIRGVTNMLPVLIEIELDDINQISDSILSRNVSNVEATAPEHSLATIVLALLEMSMSGTTMTIKRTNGTTVHVTKTITLDANASPITGIN